MADFGKIQKLIVEKNIGPSESDYHTQRTLENGGKIRVLLIKGEDEAHVEYICPYCGHYEYLKVNFSVPKKSLKNLFSVRCKACDRLIKLQRLKHQVAKERKAEEKARGE